MFWKTVDVVDKISQNLIEMEKLTVELHINPNRSKMPVAWVAKRADFQKRG